MRSFTFCFLLLLIGISVVASEKPADKTADASASATNLANLAADNNALVQKIVTLKQEVKNFGAVNAELLKVSGELKAKNLQLEAAMKKSGGTSEAFEKLTADTAAMANQLKELKARNAELEAENKAWVQAAEALKSANEAARKAHEAAAEALK